MVERELPRYRSHKQVWALKISKIEDPSKPDEESDGSLILHFEHTDYAPMRMCHDYVRKHNPTAGGYLVVYKDGYQSFSPAAAFEEGYTRI